MSRDDREDEPESRSLSLRAWSTNDRRPRGGSLCTTGNARMFRTSDGSGGNLRITPTRSKPVLSLREQIAKDRAWRYRVEDGENPRTGGWTPTWKAAPLPGTVKEAIQRQKRWRFREGPWTDTRARKCGRIGGQRGGRSTSPAKVRAARINGRKGAAYGRLGGRPRKMPASTPPTP